MEKPELRDEETFIKVIFLCQRNKYKKVLNGKVKEER
jgi:hypothetical protein